MIPYVYDCIIQFYRLLGYIVGIDFGECIMYDVKLTLISQKYKVRRIKEVYKLNKFGDVMRA